MAPATSPPIRSPPSAKRPGADRSAPPGSATANSGPSSHPTPKGASPPPIRQAAARFGLTTELVTVVPYDLPRRWAAAFHQAGFAGVRHELRHDPRARPSGVSLFGPAGPGPYPDGQADRLTTGALTRAGVPVIDVPPAAHLTIV